MDSITWIEGIPPQYSSDVLIRSRIKNGRATYWEYHIGYRHDDKFWVREGSRERSIPTSLIHSYMELPIDEVIE